MKWDLLLKKNIGGEGGKRREGERRNIPES